ncbi:MAG TPA: DUF6600 domain-containing protein [Candidatus Limnocylindrales bacterium]|nr:DUF6600 domain-containing protein [Candidatus Limnocylindrales bacterium]
MHITTRFHALTLSLFLGCAALGGIATDAVVATEVRAAVFDTTYFYAALAPDGRWYYHPRLGWVWYPVRVEVGWQPYTVGRWEWADEYGWVWASEESFGWATYHYGRWFDDPHAGWVWVPGDVWGPAWVSWRVTDGFVGWAPLPPQTYGHEISLTLDFGGGFYSRPSFFDAYANFQIGAPSHDHFVFVDYNNFTTVNINKVVIRDSSRRERLFREARDVTRYEVQGGHARFRGDFGRQEVERRIGRQIRPVRIAEADRPTRGGAAGGDGQLSIYRPRIERAPKERAQRVTPDRLGLAEAPDEQPPPEQLKQKRQRGELKTAAEERKQRGLRPLTAENPKDLETEAQVGEQRLRKEREGRGPRDAATEREGRERGGAAGADETERQRRERGGEAADAERERKQRGDAAGADAERERRERGGEAADAERERKQRGDAAGADAERERRERGGAAGADDALTPGGRKDRGGEAGGAEDEMQRQRRERESGATDPRQRDLRGTDPADANERQRREREVQGGRERGATPDAMREERGGRTGAPDPMRDQRSGPGGRDSDATERPGGPGRESVRDADRGPGARPTERPTMDRPDRSRAPGSQPTSAPPDRGPAVREQAPRGGPSPGREMREERGPAVGPGGSGGRPDRGGGAEPVRVQPGKEERRPSSEPLPDRSKEMRRENAPRGPQPGNAGPQGGPPGRKRAPGEPDAPPQP